MIDAGVAKVDITPAYPVHLSGYAAREEESAGVAQRLWAEALALGSDREGASLLLTVDNTGVPTHVTEELFARLAGRAGLTRENFAICSTHTHHSPMVTGVLPNLFSREIPPDRQAKIDQYTRELVDFLEKTALRALDDRRPARVSWGRGKVGFAENRRTEGGPVDHQLPMLCVRSPEGEVRAVFTRYACHCTTLERRLPKIHGDWAGEAREAIEKMYPGAVAMIAIGCAGDAGPSPRGTLELAREHGERVAMEVDRLLRTKLAPLAKKPEGRLLRFELPFETLPTRSEWQEKAAERGIVGYHARKNLARLDRGEVLPETLPYSVQAWLFGRDLGMIFLPGEVVVDYALRVGAEFDPERVWVNAYANDVPCYIPSQRILREGGYEAETSLWYYDRPARLTANAEEVILDAIHGVLPEFRRAQNVETEGAAER